MINVSNTKAVALIYRTLSGMEATEFKYVEGNIFDVANTTVCTEPDCTTQHAVPDFALCGVFFNATNLYGEGEYSEAFECIEDRDHTSLSVGDRIWIDGRIYECSPNGFERVC